MRITKSAHYHLAGSLANPTHLLVAFHGYAQLTQFFVKKFEQIVDRNTLVVVPEGTNYFYYGEQKRIGSNWMTSLYREEDIHENNAFLNNVLNSVRKEFLTIENISVLGFSQGVAVALRWLSQVDISLDKLILWAGNLPVDFFDISRVVAEECYFVHGDRDALKQDFSKSKKKLQKEYEASFKSIVFNGGHAIDQEVLREILSPHSVVKKRLEGIGDKEPYEV